MKGSQLLEMRREILSVPLFLEECSAERQHAQGKEDKSQNLSELRRIKNCELHRDDWKKE